MRSHTPEPTTTPWDRLRGGASHPLEVGPTERHRLEAGPTIKGGFVHQLKACATACSLCLALATTTHAQRLDFGSNNTAPKPGDGLATLALADLLDTEADDLEDDTPQRAFRHLAAALLRAGESAGPTGSEAVLAALTLAANRDELGRLLREHDQPTREYITHTLNDSEHSIRPHDLDLLFRDALAPLATDTTCGWWSPAGTYSDMLFLKKTSLLRGRVTSRHLTDEASETLAEMIDLFDAALEEPTYRRDAAEWLTLLSNAAAIFNYPPDWLDMPARDRLRTDLSIGLALCLAHPDDARTSLTRTASLVRIIKATDALDDAHQSRELRDAVNRLAAAAEGDPKRAPAAVARISKTYLRALDLINADNNLPAPTALVRQIRPMLKPLLESHRHAANAAVRVLPTILSEPDPMTEPGVLAAMHALTQAAEDLRIPAHLSTLLSTWTDDPSRPSPNTTREPIATRTMGPLTERIRTLGVAMGREDRALDALEQLRSFASFAQILPVFPGENDLRAGARSPTYRRITGDQADRLLFLLDRARDDWLRSQATDQFAERRAEDETRVRALAALLPLLRDGAQLNTMRFDWSRKIEPALNAHPGYELTRPGLETLTAGLTTRLAELAALAARNDNHALVLARAEKLRTDYAAALLCARLNTIAQQTQAHPCTIADELGLGTPPSNAWMANHRSALAALCRSAYEAAAAEGDQREMFLAHANRAALPALDSLHNPE